MKALVRRTTLCAALLLVLAGCSGRSEPVDGESGGGGGNGGTNLVEADYHTRKTPPLAAGQFEIITLSTLPEAVTDGDVLLGLRGLAAGDTYKVMRNGVDVSAAFARTEGGEVRGLVTGLKKGSNRLAATVEGATGTRRAELSVINHPITGPVISGPHQKPFICRTEDNGLGASIDANCSIVTQYKWYYRSVVNQGFTELADPYAPYPGDVIMTETKDGRAVPFVVRLETSTINRGIARLSVLDDPAARGPDAPFDAALWDGHVYYVFGESCGVGYQQGHSDPNLVLGALALTEFSADNLLINLVGIADRLAKGDLVVHNTLSAFGNHCNPLISAETSMLMKEHIIERYGPVRFMIGTNGSGAALQQYNLANSSPGILDGAMPTASFADILSTAMTVADCGLLQHYYATSSQGWSVPKQAAVNGHNLLVGNQLNAICQSWVDAFLDLLNPETGCGPVPEADRYRGPDNPAGPNLKGVRCTVQDANVNIFGRDPATGYANRPLDNTGVQYGLQALLDGAISAEEFLDVNRNIGGFNIDGKPVAERMRMNAQMARTAYLLGGVIGRGALHETPVLDHAPYLDLIPVANIHEAVRPFTIRARLAKYSGQIATQGLWRGVVTQADGYPVMEQWLEALESQQPEYGGDHTAAVTAAKPGAAADRCTFGTIGGRLELPDAILLPLGLAQLPLLPQLGPLHDLIPEFDVNIPLRVDLPEFYNEDGSGLGVCSLALPVTRTPRMVAGMPMTDDIIRCQLRPVDAADYAGKLSEAQVADMRAIFPEGVCDFSKPAAEDVAHSLLYPSLGGERQVAPHSLKYWVARSTPVH
ncbi:hypothetical protein D0B54_20695 [Solimonas sp. K1W22B-7]|uniref:DUF6351 family protein n=1 Tax=Solimonas sp. K1W22B-7 TaxID=2303331 RepID=UPI000E33751A|nr:DUF6351 family protein [Solimonas sp. K1W22B-7]AXQ30949.1 hypothetical protein D0B54_20695 [Solimonas sp. K1W22B-7]